ncbi:MAG: hypothetical protein ACK4S0_12485 [Sediminibacterium sp.]
MKNHVEIPDFKKHLSATIDVVNTLQSITISFLYTAITHRFTNFNYV